MKHKDHTSIQRRITLRWLLLALLPALISLSTGRAAAQTQAPCPLTFPTNVTFQVFYNNGFLCSSNGGSYFDANIVGIGEYLTWCSDAFGSIDVSVHPGTVPCYSPGFSFDQFYSATVIDSLRASCSTLDPTVPSWVYQPDPNFTPDQCVWNEINYLVNHKIGTNPDAIQAAIWDLISPPDQNALDTLPTFATGAPPNPQATLDRQAMVLAAKANSSFLPGPGDSRAVILAVGEDIQVTFIEIRCPPCDTIPPVFTKTPTNTNIILGCNPSSIPDCDLSQVMATDEAGPVNISCQSTDTTNGCSRTRTITYTATDVCGNTNQFVQTIVWTEDTTPPIIVCPPNTTNVQTKIFCSFTQGGWGAPPNGNNPGMLLLNNFAQVFPSGVEIGIPGAGGFSLKFTSPAAVQTFLPAGSTPGALTNDAVNPGPDTSAGVFAAQVLALQLNVSFSDAGITAPGYGDLIFHDPTSPLNGKTVRQILALANIALGGGNAGVSIGVLNPVVSSLNQAFDNCSPNGFAVSFLLPPNSVQDPGGATATDNCDSNPLITFRDVTVPGCGGSITYRTWTATDACGNSNSCTQIIVTNCVGTLSLIVPTGGNLGCNPTNKPSDDAIKSLVNVSGGCGTPGVRVTHVDSGSACQKIRTFTITATNTCGTVSTNRTVVFTWTEDTTPPVITCPGGVTNIQKGFCSYTQGGWGAPPNGNNPAALLLNNFAAVFPIGYVEIGIPGVAGYSLKFTSPAAIQNFLPAGGMPNKLTADATNPGTNTSAGVFAAQVLALKLNVAFSDAGITPSGLGDLVFNDPSSPLNGKTVRQILALANIALGGGNAGFTISVLNPILDSLNQSFDGCQASGWARTHFTLTIVVQGSATATATDNCDPNPIVMFTDVVVPGCSGSSVTYRVWKAVDACGNSNTCTQILITNCTPTISITVPPGGNLGCNALNPPTDASVKALVNATGNCSTPVVTVTHIDSITGCAKTRTFTVTASNACSTAVATRTVVYTWTEDITPPIVICPPNMTNVLQKTYCGYTQGGWGAPPNGGNPGMLLLQNFSAVYPAGYVEIGIAGLGGYSAKFTSAGAIQIFLPAGGTPGALNSDLINPGPNTSAGVFAAQVLALTLNVNFSSAGITAPGFGGLVLNDPTSPLNGKTVQQILALANIALGGGNAGVSISVLNPLLDNLNQAFDNCHPSSWASAHLLPAGSSQNSGSANATDNCDPHPLITYSDVTVAGPGTGSTITYRTWKATDSCGNSNGCTQIIVSNCTTTVSLPPPSGLTCYPKSNLVTLTWSPCTGASSYTVKRSMSKSGTYTIIKSGLTTTNYSDSAVTNGSCYYYVVCAVQNGGGGADCAPRSAVPCAPLPNPWSTQNIGTVGDTGGASYSLGKFTVVGSGADIWGAADAFRYVYQVGNGDCTVVARVSSLQKTDPWAKAGVMIRETLTAGSKHASMFLTASNGVAFQNRATTSGTSANVTTAGPTAPYWVKIVRAGNTFTGYASPNGTTWTLIGSQNITMNATVYIGLGVTSHNDGVLCTATFDNVTATP